jgi:replicative DNA helicase
MATERIKDKVVREPQSIESEKAVLGSMLISKDAVPRAMNILIDNSFYDAKHQIIYKNIMELFEKNEVIDSVSLINNLKKNKELEKVGGAYYLTGLSNEAPSFENVEYYANIVKEKYILRTVISVSKEISFDAYDEHLDVGTILDKAEQKLFNISQQSQLSQFTDIYPLLEKVLEDWAQQKKGTLTGIASGFTELDNMLSGFQKSDLIILAGRPSMGKTALALTIARNSAVTYNHKVGIFSLEMSNQQLAQRLITAEARVDSHLVRTGRLPKTEWKNLASAANDLHKAPIYIDDSASLNILELRAKARKLKSEKDVDILIVDYLQLLNQDGRSESRQQEISFISRSLKALAKELKIPIIALSQLSRAVESRAEHRPIMSDLRESGAIEQDADIILFIYRKFVYSRDELDKGLAEIIVAKHRNGPTGNLDIAFFENFAKFDNLDYRHQDINIPS